MLNQFLTLQILSSSDIIFSKFALSSNKLLAYNSNWIGFWCFQHFTRFILLDFICPVSDLDFHFLCFISFWKLIHVLLFNLFFSIICLCFVLFPSFVRYVLMEVKVEVSKKLCFSVSCIVANCKFSF